jgi:PAS domain S-box-containing protein
MGKSEKKTILLVEDETITAISEKLALEKYGYAVKTVTTGEMAVEAVGTSPEIDIILMDINLGEGMDGTRAAELILRDHDIPILFVSSHSEREIVEKTERITSYGYVVKNSSITVLDASIKMAFKLFDAYEKLKEKAESDHKHLQLLENIMDNYPGLIFWKDTNSIYQGCSNAFAKSAGLVAPKEILGKSDLDLPWKNHEAEAYRRGDRAVMGDGTLILHLLETQHSGDGSTIYLDTSKIPLYDFSGNINGILGVSLDITERNKMLESLRVSKATAEALLNVAAELIIAHDSEGDITLLNESGHELLGYTFPELIGKNWFDTCLPEEIRPEVKAYFAQLRHGSADIVVNHENDIITRNGDRKTISWHNVVLRDNDCNFIGLFSSGEDITERKRSELALRESQERLDFALEGSGLGEWDWHLKTGKIKRNERWAQMLGYSLSEIKDDIEQGIDLQHPDDRDQAWRAIQDHLGGKTDYYDISYRMKAKDGHYRWIHDCGKIMERDEAGKPVRLCGTHADISEQMEKEEKIERLLAEKELILKEVHHRIKNNMNTMGSLLSLQSQAVHEPAAAAALEDAKARMQSMGILYDSLYRTAGFTELSVKEYLPDLVDEITGNFPNSSMVKVNKHVEDLILDAKRLQPLGIIVNELLTNIMKYAFVGRERGVVDISATNTGGHIAIAVRDNGGGMPESVSFEKSTGFGLQLVYALTQQLNGTIRIERGNGTNIILEFES